MKLLQFYCPACAAWFDAFTNHGEPAPRRTHTCGTLCSTGIQPGPRAGGIKTGKMRSDDDRRRTFQRQFSLKDSEMANVSRAEMERVMTQKGLSFVDKSWDENVNGGRRESGNLVDLPPDTEDVNKIREWNEKHMGRDFVQQQQEQIRDVFDRASRGDLQPLPRADEVAVHDSPHIIDVERTVEELSAAPVVAPDRKRELAGRLVTK